MIGNKYYWGCKLINLKCLFMTKSEQRRTYRKEEKERLLKNVVRDYKWGASYSVFDGEELLEASIKSIRKSCDYVNVVYQTKSWYGNQCDNNLLVMLNKLKNKGLIDEIIEYIPNTSLSASKQEREKRNVGLRYAKKAGVNYFITMDCDEFYLDQDVEKAKRSIIKNNITHSFINVVNYAMLPTQRFLRTPSYVQFFSKIKRTSKLSANKHIITIVDPTRILSHFCCAKYFFLSDVEMHHMTLIKKNLYKKFNNSTARYAYRHIISIKEKEKDWIKDTVESEDLFGLMNIARKYRSINIKKGTTGV